MAIQPPDELAVFRIAFRIESDELREDYLRQACGGDEQLYDRVSAILKANADSQKFLESPINEAAATIDVAIAERPGTQIGPYKLLQEIGEGGMGVVYMAHQREPVRRRVALKIIKPGMDTREVIGRFQAEEQALAMMDHPNIAKVHDAGTTESGRPYFVMELVNGVPITEYADDNNLTTKQRLELFVLVCNAVQHAHQKGIIHRDIKPTNILVTLHDGVPVPKIIDFGISKAINQDLTANTVFTGLGQMVGTPLYMSPEQAERSGLGVDTRSDIYSLGVLLYELLTGTTPFDNEQLQEAGLDEFRRLIREEEPQRPSTRVSTMGQAGTTVSMHRKTDPVELSHTLRQEVDWIVMKALEKDRTRRYETAADFARDILRYLNDEPVEACPPSTAYRLRKFTRRNRVAVWTTVAVALALILGAGVAAGQAYRATKAERFANKQLEIAKEQRRLAKEQEQLAKKQKRLAEEAAEREKKLRVEAEAARKQAETVTDFLVEAFRSPDPERDGHTITVVEVLDKARDRVSKEFQNDLPLQAHLLHALGLTYRALGLPQESVKLMEKALDTFRETLGNDSLETLNTIGWLGHAYHDAKRYEDALHLGEEMVRLATRIHGPENGWTLSAQRLVAATHMDLDGHLEQAIELLEKMLPLHQKVKGPEHPHTVIVMNNLAVSYDRDKRIDESLELKQQALEISMRTVGKEHPNTITYMGNLGLQYSALHRYNKALPLLKEAYELSIKVNGPEHPSTFRRHTSLAGLYHKTGHLDEAIDLWEQHWEGSERKLGLEDPTTHNAAVKLARVYGSAGRYEEGIQLLETVREAAEAKFGLRPQTLRMLADLARLYFSKGDYEEAIKLRRILLRQNQAVGDSAARYIANNQVLLALILIKVGCQKEAAALVDEGAALIERCDVTDLEVLKNLGVVYLELGRYEDAVKLAQTKLEKCQTEYGDDDFRAISSKLCLARAYAASGKLTEAVDSFREVLAGYTKIGGPEHPATLETKGLLAGAYLSGGNHDEALALLQQVVQGRMRRIGSKHPDTLAAKILLAETYLEKDKYTEAEPLLIEAHQGFAQRDKASHTPYDRTQTRKALTLLVQLYEKQNQPEKAATWKEKLDALTDEPKKSNGDK